MQTRYLEEYIGKCRKTSVHFDIIFSSFKCTDCWLVGMFLFSQSMMAMIMAVFFTANILFWKKLEEMQLQKDYPEYKEYIKRTYF